MPANSPAPEFFWQEFLQSHSALGLPEIDLATLQPGDRLIVETLHTRYGFEWGGAGEVKLISNRADRPSGPVRIEGCAFGQSSSIKPGQLFCGGNLEYLSDAGRMRNRTTAIRSLVLLRRSAGGL
jgi:hypothetical protein